MATVEANHIKKRYGTHSVLRDVTVAVGSGQIVQILGGNGSGKTTLLKILATLTSFDEGTLTVLNKSLPGEKHMVRKQVSAFISPEPFFPALTVAENLDTVARLTAVSQSIEKKHLVERFGLEDVYHQVATTLSKGFKRRLGLAIALGQSTNLLLLDEPFDGLDRTGVDLIMAEVKRRAEGGEAVIFTSHSPFGSTLAERTLEIVNGVLQEVPA